MKPRENDHAIIFESYTEARIATDVLIRAGRRDLAESITPEVPISTLGLIEFIYLFNKRNRAASEYSTPVDLAPEIINAMGRIAIPPDALTEKISPEHAAGKMLTEFIPKVSDEAPYSIDIVSDL